MLLRIVAYSAILVFTSIGFWIVHNSASDATWTARQLYFLEAWRAGNNQHCNGPSQQQLRSLLKTAANKAGSLASQLAYLSPTGQLTLCSSAAYGEQPNANARFRYASLTKLLTAQAVMQAMANAGLPLDTPLTYFVVQAAQAADDRWQAVTIAQLLNHSAGLDRLRSPDPMTAHARTPWCPGNLDQLTSTKLDFDPGTAFGYSNLTYCLLGVVLEQLSGQDYRSAMEKQFDLSAYGIRFIDGPYLDDEVRYDFRHAGFYGENYYRYLDFPALSSSAGLSGSASALVRLLGDLYRQQRLTVLPAMLPENCTPSVMKSCYGSALFPYQQGPDGPLLWVQQGYLFGASSLAVLDTQGGILVWLGNGKPAKGSAADKMLEHVYNTWQQLAN